MPRVLVIASRNARSASSALIRAAQAWRAWSHTTDVLTAGDHTRTVEAIALRGGMTESTVADLHTRSTARLVLSREVSSDTAAARDAWLLAQVGRGYDWTGAVGAAWMQWRAWDDPSRWWCSEATAVCAATHGLLPISPYIRGVMPTQCVDLLLAAGWEVTSDACQP